MFVKSTLSKCVTDVSIPVQFKEQIWLKLRLRGNDILIVGCIYRSPSSLDANDKKIGKVIKSIVKMKPTHLLIAGDFNMPSINWDTVTTTKGQFHIR